MIRETGNGYLASTEVETSVANAEILPTPVGWTHPYSCYKLTLINQDACTVRLNNTFDVYLQNFQGLNISRGDLPITSVKITENGKKFTFFACY